MNKSDDKRVGDIEGRLDTVDTRLSRALTSEMDAMLDEQKASMIKERHEMMVDCAINTLKQCGTYDLIEKSLLRILEREFSAGMNEGLSGRMGEDRTLPTLEDLLEIK